MEKRIESRIRAYISDACRNDLYKVYNDYSYKTIGEKAKAMLNILRQHKVPFKHLGTGTNRVAVRINGYVFKIACDDSGYEDNKTEFAYSKSLQPYVARTYEYNGLIVVQEYVIIMNDDDFKSAHWDIVETLNKISSMGFLMIDIGYNPKNRTNWGWRMLPGGSKEPVCCDFGDIYLVDDPNIAKCGNDRATEIGSDADLCNEKMTYDTNFIGLYCPHCDKKKIVDSDIDPKSDSKRTMILQSNARKIRKRIPTDKLHERLDALILDKNYFHVLTENISYVSIRPPRLINPEIVDTELTSEEMNDHTLDSEFSEYEYEIIKVFGIPMLLAKDTTFNINSDLPEEIQWLRVRCDEEDLDINVELSRIALLNCYDSIISYVPFEDRFIYPDDEGNVDSILLGVGDIVNTGHKTTLRHYIWVMREKYGTRYDNGMLITEDYIDSHRAMSDFDGDEIPDIEHNSYDYDEDIEDDEDIDILDSAIDTDFDINTIHVDEDEYGDEIFIDEESDYEDDLDEDDDDDDDPDDDDDFLTDPDDDDDDEIEDDETISDIIDVDREFDESLISGEIMDDEDLDEEDESEDEDLDESDEEEDESEDEEEDEVTLPDSGLLNISSGPIDDDSIPKLEKFTPSVRYQVCMLFNIPVLFINKRISDLVIIPNNLSSVEAASFEDGSIQLSRTVNVSGENFYGTYLSVIPFDTDEFEVGMVFDADIVDSHIVLEDRKMTTKQYSTLYANDPDILTNTTIFDSNYIESIIDEDIEEPDVDDSILDVEPVIMEEDDEDVDEALRRIVSEANDEDEDERNRLMSKSYKNKRRN
jgi:hypothetical protein